MACPVEEIAVWFAGHVIVTTGAGTVLKPQIGPGVDPLEFLATTRHWYVIPAVSVIANEHTVALATVGVLGSIDVADRYKSKCVA
jgi:hypothetical protein